MELHTPRAANTFMVRVLREQLGAALPSLVLRGTGWALLTIGRKQLRQGGQASRGRNRIVIGVDRGKIVSATKRAVAASPARGLLSTHLSRQTRILFSRPDAFRESRWTATAGDRCPHLDRWHALDWEATEFEVSELVAGFVRALQPDYVIETGTASAQTTYLIGRALRKNGHGRLVSLEIDPACVRAGQHMCRRLPVEVRCQSSMEFTPGEPIDFAWFDSLLDLRVPEFRRYLPHMHARTIVGFHDTAHQNASELREGLASLIDEGLLRMIELTTPRGVAFAQVTAARPV